MNRSAHLSTPPAPDRSTPDSTLHQMEREARLGRREADALIRLSQMDGSEAWVLVHIEIQAQLDPDFASAPDLRQFSKAIL